MSTTILTSHVKDSGFRRPLLVSILGHVLLFLFVTVGSSFWGPAYIEIGSGEGGGRAGDILTVGLADRPSGGAGMYKPSIVPQPQAAPVREEPEEEPEDSPETVPEEDVFEQPKQEPVPEPPEPPSEARRPPPPRKPEPTEPAKGAIPGRPEPGVGGASAGGAGSGGGFGGGSGVSIGTGTGGAGVDSWYVRQVEKRIGQNWLRSSLGRLINPVRTTVSFAIARNGLIEDVRIEEGSGIRSVDLAAERAVLASSPLPTLHLELQRRNIRFVAHFEYPPR